ncbi:MAG: RimK family alpha-L-glutamate ligase [Candidatus Woesearchaeota archaeon]
MKLAVISLGGKTSLEIIEKAKGLFDAVDNLDLKRIEIKSNSKEQMVCYNGEALKKYDCICIRGSFRYSMLQSAISEIMKGKCYMPLSPEAFSICHNKFSSILVLQKAGVPIPETYYAPSIGIAKKVLEKVQFPIIIKIPHGTQGKGVMFADSLPSAKSVIDALEAFEQPYIIQEYIETGATDIRAIVVGDKVVAAMRRKGSPQEIRANIHMGGVGAPYELDPDTEAMAVKAAEAVGAGICGVDILEGMSGKKNVVLELNASPGLGGITAATKKDIAGDIVRFLYAKSKSFTSDRSDDDYNSILESISPEKVPNGKIITNLNVKLGMIKLPPVVTKLSAFKAGDEVMVEARKGLIEVKKHNTKYV